MYTVAGANNSRGRIRTSVTSPGGGCIVKLQVSWPVRRKGWTEGRSKLERMSFHGAVADSKVWGEYEHDIMCVKLEDPENRRVPAKEQIGNGHRFCATTTGD